jgi:hypothetical protein
VSFFRKRFAKPVVSRRRAGSASGVPPTGNARRFGTETGRNASGSTAAPRVKRRPARLASKATVRTPRANPPAAGAASQAGHRYITASVS